MTTSIQSRVAENIGLILGVGVGADAAVHRRDIPQWDSLKHIEIALMLEEEFGIRLSADEIQRIDSVQTIAALVAEKHGA